MMSTPDFGCDLVPVKKKKAGPTAQSQQDYFWSEWLLSCLGKWLAKKGVDVKPGDEPWIVRDGSLYYAMIDGTVLCELSRGDLDQYFARFRDRSGLVRMSVPLYLCRIMALTAFRRDSVGFNWVTTDARF